MQSVQIAEIQNAQNGNVYKFPKCRMHKMQKCSKHKVQCHQFASTFPTVQAQSAQCILNMQHTVHKFTHVHTAILHICCMYNNAMYRYMQASLCPRALYNCTCILMQMFQLHFLPICTYLPFALKQAVDVTCICPQPVKRRGKYMFCRLLWIFCKRSKCTKLPMVPYKNKELNIDKDFANLQNMQNHSFSPCTVAYIAKHKASRHNHICWMLSHAACLRLLPNYYFYSQLCVFKKISVCSGAHFPPILATLRLQCHHK